MRWASKIQDLFRTLLNPFYPVRKEMVERLFAKWDREAKEIEEWERNYVQRKLR